MRKQPPLLPGLLPPLLAALFIVTAVVASDAPVATAAAGDCDSDIELRHAITVDYDGLRVFEEIGRAHV